MKKQIVTALIKKYEGEIAEAKANIEIYLTNPAGIGEHPDVTAAIQEELDQVAKWEDQVSVIQKYLKAQ